MEIITNLLGSIFGTPPEAYRTLFLLWFMVACLAVNAVWILRRMKEQRMIQIITRLDNEDFPKEEGFEILESKSVDQ